MRKIDNIIYSNQPIQIENIVFANEKEKEYFYHRVDPRMISSIPEQIDLLIKYDNVFMFNNADILWKFIHYNDDRFDVLFDKLLDMCYEDKSFIYYYNFLSIINNNAPAFIHLWNTNLKFKNLCYVNTNIAGIYLQSIKNFIYSCKEDEVIELCNITYDIVETLNITYSYDQLFELIIIRNITNNIYPHIMIPKEKIDFNSLFKKTVSSLKEFVKFLNMAVNYWDTNETKKEITRRMESVKVHQHHYNKLAIYNTILNEVNLNDELKTCIQKKIDRIKK